jgi:hypothetical protein
MRAYQKENSRTQCAVFLGKIKNGHFDGSLNSLCREVTKIMMLACLFDGVQHHFQIYRGDHFYWCRTPKVISEACCAH